MHQWIGSTLVQMVFRLFGAKPLSEPVLACCQLDPYVSEILIKIQNFAFRKKAYENIFCEEAAILSKGRWVNWHLWDTFFGVVVMSLEIIIFMSSPWDIELKISTYVLLQNINNLHVITMVIVMPWLVPCRTCRFVLYGGRKARPILTNALLSPRQIQ